MEEKKNFEAIFKEDLYQYLLSIDKVDAHLPEAPDLEELWQKVGESYLPDAIREFAKYPTVSLGWIMYVGMALAKYWNEEAHKAVTNVVAECASRSYSKLIHLNLQPGSEEAFRGFVAALHQMFLMGIAVELKMLGYHMTKM